MLFNIENDFGDKIVGYIVPDAFTETPAVKVLSQGTEILRLTANDPREALVQAGRHGTGLCGFSIGTDLIPELPGLTDLEIYELSTDILIYRRPQPGQTQAKVLRLETHLFPLWRLDGSFDYLFQYFNKGLERFGRETVTQLFLLHQINSVYLAGRILYKNYAYYIDQGFEMTVLIQDPYREFAERILVLQQLDRLGTQYLGERDGNRFEPAVQFFKGLDVTNPKAVKKALNEMPVEIAHLMVDPVTRQLVTSTPDEMPTGASLAACLDILSECKVVGLREEPDLYMNALGSWFGIDPMSLPSIPQFPKAEALATIIAESRMVNHLIERDLELYWQVRSALADVSTD